MCDVLAQKSFCWKCFCVCDVMAQKSFCWKNFYVCHVLALYKFLLVMFLCVCVWCTGSIKVFVGNVSVCVMYWIYKVFVGNVSVCVMYWIYKSFCWICFCVCDVLALVIVLNVFFCVYDVVFNWWVWSSQYIKYLFIYLWSYCIKIPLVWLVKGSCFQIIEVEI